MLERLKSKYQERQLRIRKEAICDNIRFNLDTSSRLKSKLIELELERVDLYKELREIEEI